MQKQLFAEILLPLAIENTYTYSIPDEFSESLLPGFRVVVTLGKRKLYTGIVVRIHDTLPDFETKPILSVFDKFPILSKRQSELITWVSIYYCCSPGEVMNAAIPSKLIPSGETKVYFNSDFQQTINPGKSEQKILDYLTNSQESDVDSIALATDIKNPMKQLENLASQGIISLCQNLVKVYKPALMSFVLFDMEVLDEMADECNKILKRNSKQKDVLSFLTEKCVEDNCHSYSCSEKFLLEKLDVSKATLNSLAAKGLLKLERREESRIKPVTITLNNTFELSEIQQNKYNQINKEFKEKKPVLLYGVTSSGKTEIYIKLIEQAIDKGKEVLYLLPEIALTSQIIERLRSYFGDKIGVFHSKYSIDARSEVYKLVLEQKLKIILGVRSAVFLPFSNLGLIIVDEEHESSYKQNDPDPRYHARDAAIVLSKLHESDIVLGSATPSVESFYNAKSGKYSLVELKERYGNVKMPEIFIADMKDAYKRKIMSEHFHPILVDHIKESLAKNEQVILFQNRRGFAPNLECRDCGWVPYCNNCNVSLTYHKWENKLVCHYCGEKHEIVHECGSCKSNNLIAKGLGTERIEDEAAVLFPTARLSRLDYDTANSRKRFEKIIRDFENHSFDILIGTQMVTKGLDFEKVGLVGILNADNMLNFPDFRAFERAYQLMAQVSGRAGRRDKQGKVIIQTFTVDHPIISYVVANDYSGMFDSQIDERQSFKYPPFWSFIIIRLKHKDRSRLHRGAKILADSLKADLFGRVKGPEEPLINRISNYFILNIHVRFEKSASPIRIKQAILQKIKNLKTESEFGGIISEIDVDPV